ncbi:hypothetical protein L2725_19210 [Shewanella corallii]|uniref:Uncharacterized protein n=1 Tax=Shewanella corallii TaxID=560080 RepID=A0ABT0NBS1_9GAMM|nr:hypothetical protein [Shewanella corallii]MCL2915874.1 hypothetical protein [Shewanella corallii]
MSKLTQKLDCRGSKESTLWVVDTAQGSNSCSNNGFWRLTACSDPVSDQIESWLKTRPEFTQYGYKIKGVDGREGFYYAAIQLSPEEVTSYKTLYALAKASNDY